MKAKLSDLNPNPYKKLINKGEFDNEQIEKLKITLREGHTTTFPVVKFKGKIHLVSHHHRVEALKQMHGEDYEVEITFNQFDEEQLFRGMVEENIVQRKGEFREETQNVVAVETYLNENPEKLKCLRDSRKHQEKLNKEYKNKATAGDVAAWLNLYSKDKKDEIMKHDKVTELLNIHHNLDASLQEEIEKQSKSAETEGINLTQGIELAKFKDKKEQKDMADVLKKSREQRVRDQRKLVTKYKESTPKVQEKIRGGETDIADIETEIWNDYRGKVKDEFFDKKPIQLSLVSQLDKLLDKMDLVFKEWERFEKLKVQYCKPNEKKRFELNRKKYCKRLGCQK